MNRFVAAITALAIPTLALGTGPPPDPADDKLLDFALEFCATQTVFDYATSISVPTKLERLGVSWYERFGRSLELGMYGGRVFLTQTGNPATAGLEPDGYYAGLGLRATLLETSVLQLFLKARYSYQRATRDANGQSLVLTWNEPQAQLGITLSPVPRLRIFGGGVWESIDGSERVSGNAPRTTDFERRGGGGGFFGLELALEPDGYVGMEARSGVARGGEIYFKKRY